MGLFLHKCTVWWEQEATYLPPQALCLVIYWSGFQYLWWEGGKENAFLDILLSFPKDLLGQADHKQERYYTYSTADSSSSSSSSSSWGFSHTEKGSWLSHFFWYSICASLSRVGKGGLGGGSRMRGLSHIFRFQDPLEGKRKQGDSKQKKSPPPSVPAKIEEEGEMKKRRGGKYSWTTWNALFRLFLLCTEEIAFALQSQSRIRLENRDREGIKYYCSSIYST